MVMTTHDLIVIGAGPGGCAAAISAAREGADVLVLEKGRTGRDKVCGDGLTPRAVAALDRLAIDMTDAHRIDGLRMIAGRTRRELPWPDNGTFPPRGAVWPRRILDARLADAALNAGAEIRWDSTALPIFDNDRVVGVSVDGAKHHGSLVILAAGAPGAAARSLGAGRVADEPYGLAIRAYAPSPRHEDRHIEACLTLRSADGTPVPGYGWMFPTGDGTVNIGVGALSTMKGFRKLNLNSLLDVYQRLVRDEWDLGDYVAKPRAWRLPMSAQRRSGDGWVAVGDAAGLINPMNGEGIDYALESGMLAAELFIQDPSTASVEYDAQIGARFDSFLRTGRRFSFLIGHPLILRAGLKVAVGTQTASNITLEVMGNLIDNQAPGSSGRVMRVADKVLGAVDPLLRRTKAKAS